MVHRHVVILCTIRYDTIRDGIFYVRSKADGRKGQLNLAHGTKKTKNVILSESSRRNEAVLIIFLIGPATRMEFISITRFLRSDFHGCKQLRQSIAWVVEPYRSLCAELQPMLLFLFIPM